MVRLIRSAAAVLVAAAMTCCGGGGSGGELALTPAMAGTTLTSSISSVQTGIAYSFDVWLPPGYAEGTATYPVIYATDCEYRWAALLQDVQQFAAHGGAPVILVNICAGTSDRRFVDFTMPGATSYFRFLTLELIPLIDATYRTNPANRTLSGHSLSGEFVMYALYLENPTNRYFTSIVSEECSCWFDAQQNYSATLAQPAAMEQAMLAASGGNLPINLDIAGLSEPVIENLYLQILSRNYRSLRLIQPNYLGYTHVGMDAPAFYDALSFIFGGP
jgi:hypothetical protein